MVEARVSILTLTYHLQSMFEHLTGCSLLIFISPDTRPKLTQCLSVYLDDLIPVEQGRVRYTGQSEHFRRAVRSQ